MHRAIRRVMPALATRCMAARLTHNLQPWRPVASVPRRQFHALPSLWEEAKTQQHQLLIGFTCTECNERSHHIMSKLAYTKGVVLIECPGCKNRHLIADNLGWFRDKSTTVEDLVKEKGEAIRKIVVDEQGVEKMGNLMEWLPEITEEERLKKEKASQEAKAKKRQTDEND